MSDHATGYREGHQAGYTKGRDDGIGIGYADAKLSLATMRQALEATLGSRS